jgi:glycosyltransferase involved in cell wall biosynthesis
MAVAKYPFPIIGGLERQAYELAKALVRRGHVVNVLSSRFDPRQNSVELMDDVRVYRLKWIQFRPARFALSPFHLARTLLRLKTSVDLVHVHSISWFGAFVTLFVKALGLPLLTKLPNTGEFGIPGMRRGPFGVLRIALLRISDAVVAMTPESMTELKNIGFPPERVLKVTNGITLSPAASSQPRSSTIVKAVFVGRLSPEKGLPDLLHTWAIIKARASRPIKLTIVGDGPQAGELRALAEALDLGGTVEFYGFCSNVPEELAKADLFVLPSYAEGNSNAVLEAMHAGLPVVATNLAGAAIQVGTEGERFLVAPGDRNALADRLRELIENEPLRNRLGRAMRARVESVFAIDRVAATYEQAYELILSGRPEQLPELNRFLFRIDNLQCAGRRDLEC